MPPSRYFMSAISIEHELGRPITVTDLEGRFRRNYNRVNFMFKHELAGNSLFELESLVELTRRMPDHGEHYWATGEVPVNNTWSDGTIGRQSLRDTIINIEHNNSTVVLRHTEQDPVFAPTNFLLQITGDKWFHIFDQSDRTLVTDRELEDFFAFNRHRELVRTDRRDECVKHDLRAGYGVHVPTCAPHWTRNRENVSVALSVNYELRSVERLEKLYRFNHRLRKLGLSPAAPNVSGWRDRIKLAAADGMAAMRVVGKQREGRPYQVWTPPAD
jgi:hypothetical protein